jgi:hypothetical protein
LQKECGYFSLIINSQRLLIIINPEMEVSEVDEPLISKPTNLGTSWQNRDQKIRAKAPTTSLCFISN